MQQRGVEDYDDGRKVEFEFHVGDWMHRHVEIRASFDGGYDKLAHIILAHLK